MLKIPKCITLFHAEFDSDNNIFLTICFTWQARGGHRVDLRTTSGAAGWNFDGDMPRVYKMHGKKPSAHTAGSLREVIRKVGSRPLICTTKVSLEPESSQLEEKNNGEGK